MHSTEISQYNINIHFSGIHVTRLNSIPLYGKCYANEIPVSQTKKAHYGLRLQDRRPPYYNLIKSPSIKLFTCYTVGSYAVLGILFFFGPVIAITDGLSEDHYPFLLRFSTIDYFFAIAAGV